MATNDYPMNLKCKITAIAAALVIMTGATACSGKTEKTEETVADIEAAQLEGREAARVFVNRPWRDTVELQSSLLEARARQSKYVRAHKPQSAAAFDSAFVSTLKTVRPDVARELEAAQKQLAK